MNTKGNQYGNIAQTVSGFLAKGWNPIEQKGEHLGHFKTEAEATKAVNNFNFNLFEKHTWMLPRCIAIGRRARVFIFSLQINGKTMRISQFKSLDEAVNAKHEFINKLIS